MRKKSIVVADENSTWLDALKRTLEQSQLFSSITTFCSGELAYAHIMESKPDILILDLVLPMIDGLYIINQIYENQEYNPFIYVISAINTTHSINMLSNLNVNYYSVKPIRPVIAYNNLMLLLNADGKEQAGQDGGQIANRQPAAQFGLVPADTDWDSVINSFLYRLGAPLALYSTRCTSESIKYYINNMNGRHISAQDVYQYVATVVKSDTHPNAIERNVRSTVKTIQQKHTPFYKSVFSCDKLSNAKFMFESSVYLYKSISAIKPPKGSFLYREQLIG